MKQRRAPRKSFRDRTGHDAAFIIFAAIAVIFGADGALCAAVSLVSLVMGLIGAEISKDVTSYGLSGSGGAKWGSLELARGQLSPRIVSASNIFSERNMSTQEVQTADAQARITLPATFAEAAVVVEVLSASEVRIRKVDEASQELCGLPESSVTRLSDRDRDRFLELVESRPAANASLRKAMIERQQRDG